MMRLAFVGMGSIGKRHLRNVCVYLDGRGQAYSIDLYRSGHGGQLDSTLAEKVRRTLSSEGEIPDTYDAVFITNPTAMHYETIRKFAPAATAMFIEKPVFHIPDVDPEALGLLQNGIYYVACPLRYHPVLQYVRKHIPYQEAYAAQAICSSYLPDWRPGTDYRRCYSARRDMGGGVDIDLIHEWDYLTWLFGPVTAGVSMKGQISALEIDSCDIAAYLAKAERTFLELHLDYFGRKAIRQLRLFLPDDTVDCDILAGTVCWQISGEHLALDNRRDGYQIVEISHFFDILEGRCPNDSSISGALQVLRYAYGKFPAADTQTFSSR